MTQKPTVKSAFPPIRPTAVTISRPIAAARPPQRKQAAPASPASKNGVNGCVTINVEFFVEIVDRPERQCPCWAYAGDPRKSDTFAKRIVAVLNKACWPTAAALERDDRRALKWFVCVAICERLSVQTHPILYAIALRLSQMALQRASVHQWERCLWSAYQLMNADFVARLDSVQLSVGSVCKFSELVVQVSAQRLADWNTRQSKSQKHT